MKMGGGHVPIQLWIGVTYRCQCKCIHCCLGPALNQGQPELSTRRIIDLISEARSLSVMGLVFFGGEPLLREDIVELVAHTRERGLLPTLFTNGLLLTPDKVKALKRAGLARCNISIDSSDPERHDRLRGIPGCHRQAVEGARSVAAEHINCTIWTYVSKEDVQNGLIDLRGMARLAEETGVDRLIVLFPIAAGNWLCGWEDKVLTREERNVVRELEFPSYVQLEFPREEGYCRAGREFAYISPQGDLTPCATIPFSYGNINREPLSAIMSRLAVDVKKYFMRSWGRCVLQDPEYRARYLGEADGETEGECPMSSG